MSEISPTPIAVIDLVNDYAQSERDAVEKYATREPLDESGMWDLQALAQRIYAAGWSDGYAARGATARGMRR
jgi:hypothetical protein